MHSFAYRALVAGFLALAWAHGNKQRVLYEAAQKMNYGASLGNDYTSFKWDGSASAVIDLAWQGETSISSRCDSHSLWKKETTLDVSFPLPSRPPNQTKFSVRRHRNLIPLEKHHNLQKHNLRLLQSPQRPPSP